MITPMIHLNGTSADELVCLRLEVLCKLRETQEALAKMSPNGRDYYLHPTPLAFELAVSQHSGMMRDVTSLIEQVTLEVELIQAEADGGR